MSAFHSFPLFPTFDIYFLNSPVCSGAQNIVGYFFTV